MKTSTRGVQERYRSTVAPLLVLLLVLLATSYGENAAQATNIDSEQMRIQATFKEDVFAGQATPVPPRRAVSVALGRASALLSGAVLEVKSVSMSVPRWSDFVLLKREFSSSNSNSGGSGSWQVAGELQSSNVSWLKTAEVVLAPRTAKSQTVTVSTNVTLVDSVSSRAVVVEVWHVVRSIPDPRSLVSSAAMLQPVVVESREDEPALLSLGKLSVLGESLDSAAVWAEYWSVDVQVHGRDIGASVSGLTLDGESSEVQERAGGSVVGVSNVSAATLAWNASDDGSAAAGVLQVVPVASFAGVFRGSLVLVFRDKRNAAQKVEVARPLSISWRRRDLDLSVELRTMVFANESVSMPPRQAVSVALGRASALLSGAVLEVKSVSMSVPRWSDFVLLKREFSSSNSNSGSWQVAGELQSSNVSWLKTAEVVLAPRTAKSQTVTVSTNVTLVDSVSSRAVVVEVWHVVRSIPDPRSLVSSAAMLQPVVVESREDEPALLSLGKLSVLGESLDSAAVWAEYWSVDVILRGVALSKSIKHVILWGVPFDVGVFGGGHIVEMKSRPMTPGELVVTKRENDSLNWLEVRPKHSFRGIFNGSVVIAFRSKVSSLEVVEVACPLRVAWTSEVIDVPTNDTVNVTQFLGPFKMESVVFENETLVVIPRSYVMASFERGKESLAGPTS
ncbi:hypothetical protein PF008_g1978 [Phytophthora fragariae]|uniref:Transmembrane protein family 132 middle domain-containing protein n=1 Tax=Phytophthora fragariae TaxID=53985 RepID=A0A6G0SJL1_9STRA|nr:hypothetical protein PF008_g1978 [Phytophthora fragariae]